MGKENPLSALVHKRDHVLCSLTRDQVEEDNDKEDGHPPQNVVHDFVFRD